MGSNLKGVNLGGWLMMEGYILGGRNIPESDFKRDLKKSLGAKELHRFEDLFYGNFIREEDFSLLAGHGVKLLRIPFHYKIPLKYLKEAARLANKYGLKVIFDMHAAPGAQNHDWHSDSGGKAALWSDQDNQEKTFALWENIAQEFKYDPAVIGYDLINEPVMPGPLGQSTLKLFYNTLIARIRAIDKRKVLYLEGDLWAQKIDFLRDLAAGGIALSIHLYQPHHYTLGLVPALKFPGTAPDGYWDAGVLRRHLDSYYDFSRSAAMPIFVGEFGVNWRGGYVGELSYLRAVVDILDEMGFDWTYWTYKAVAGHLFPDGLYQYVADDKYVARCAVDPGWGTYARHWRRSREKIVDFWRTGNYTPNSKLIDVLFNKLHRGDRNKNASEIKTEEL